MIILAMLKTEIRRALLLLSVESVRLVQAHGGCLGLSPWSRFPESVGEPGYARYCV